MLHGEVHGALEALDAGVDHLPRQPPERLLDVQVEVGVVQVVVPQPCRIGSHERSRSETHRQSDQGNRKQNDEIQREPGRGSRPVVSDPGWITVFPEARGDGVHVEARQRVAARVHQPVGQRVHQRRHGGGRRRDREPLPRLVRRRRDALLSFASSLLGQKRRRGAGGGRAWTRSWAVGFGN